MSVRWCLLGVQNVCDCPIQGYLRQCLGYEMGGMGESGNIWGYPCPRVSRGVGGCKGAQGGVRQYVPFNFRQFQEITNEILNIFQYIRRSQMSLIPKCPKDTVILILCEASREVSEPSYKLLLFNSSRRSYCITVCSKHQKPSYHNHWLVKYSSASSKNTNVFNMRLKHVSVTLIPTF